LNVLDGGACSARGCDGSAHYYGQSECNVVLAQGVVNCLANNCEVQATLGGAENGVGAAVAAPGFGHDVRHRMTRAAL
jgi:hypothetical protein